MRDWKELVKERLAVQGLPESDEEEVIAELAAHLEEAYEDARLRGLTEGIAVEAALQGVEDWHVLAANICRAKAQEDSMNHRTRSLWLPALVALLGASVSLMLTQFLGMQPHLVWIGRMGMTFYWPWLATLPFFGAVGAYLSQCAQGATRARLAAGLSPALIMLIVMCLILPWGLLIDGLDFFRLVSFGLGLANWVVIPGVALLVGALPFLKGHSSREGMPALE